MGKVLVLTRLYHLNRPSILIPTLETPSVSIFGSGGPGADLEAPGGPAERQERLLFRWAGQFAGFGSFPSVVGPKALRQGLLDF